MLWVRDCYHSGTINQSDAFGYIRLTNRTRTKSVRGNGIVGIKSEPLLTGIGRLCEVGILIQTCYFKIN